MILNPESEVLETLAKSILLAARAAPKARGVDDIVTALVEKEDIELLASTMEKLGDERGAGFTNIFKRDAAYLRNAGATILIGVKTSGDAGFDCRACGFNSCAKCRIVKRLKQNSKALTACSNKLTWELKWVQLLQKPRKMIR